MNQRSRFIEEVIQFIKAEDMLYFSRQKCDYFITQDNHENQFKKAYFSSEYSKLMHSFYLLGVYRSLIDDCLALRNY